MGKSDLSNQSKVYLYFEWRGEHRRGDEQRADVHRCQGSSTINGSTPGASTSTQWLFDPCAFMDSDGQSYLYFGGQYPTKQRASSCSNTSTGQRRTAQRIRCSRDEFFQGRSLPAQARAGIYYYTYSRNRFEFRDGRALLRDEFQSNTGICSARHGAGEPAAERQSTTITTPSFPTLATGISPITTAPPRFKGAPQVRRCRLQAQPLSRCS